MSDQIACHGKFLRAEAFVGRVATEVALQQRVIRIRRSTGVLVRARISEQRIWHVQRELAAVIGEGLLVEELPRVGCRERTDHFDELVAVHQDVVVEVRITLEPSVHLTGITIERCGNRNRFLQIRQNRVVRSLPQDPVDNHPAGTVPDDREMLEWIRVVAALLYSFLEVREKLCDEKFSAMLEPAPPVPSEDEVVNPGVFTPLGETIVERPTEDLDSSVGDDDSIALVSIFSVHVVDAEIEYAAEEVFNSQPHLVELEHLTGRAGVEVRFPGALERARHATGEEEECLPRALRRAV